MDFLGLSWHVMVCLWKSNAGEMQMKTMVYLMGHVKQVQDICEKNIILKKLNLRIGLLGFLTWKVFWDIWKVKLCQIWRWSNWKTCFGHSNNFFQRLLTLDVTMLEITRMLTWFKDWLLSARVLECSSKHWTLVSQAMARYIWNVFPLFNIRFKGFLWP